MPKYLVLDWQPTHGDEDCGRRIEADDAEAAVRIYVDKHYDWTDGGYPEHNQFSEFWTKDEEGEYRRHEVRVEMHPHFRVTAGQVVEARGGPPKPVRPIEEEVEDDSAP